MRVNEFHYDLPTREHQRQFAEHLFCHRIAFQFGNSSDFSNLYFSDFTDLNNSDNVASVQPSLTDVVISPAPPLNDLAIDNDGNNRAVAIGASSGLGSFGALGIFWLGVFCYATTLNRRRQTGS